MSVADILITITTWVFQSVILPIMPQNLPLISVSEFYNFLNVGNIKANLVWAFSGISPFFNIELLLIILETIAFAEILLWFVRVGFYVVRIIRG